MTNMYCGFLQVSADQQKSCNTNFTFFCRLLRHLSKAMKNDQTQTA